MANKSPKPAREEILDDVTTPSADYPQVDTSLIEATYGGLNAEEYAKAMEEIKPLSSLVEVPKTHGIEEYVNLEIVVHSFGFNDSSIDNSPNDFYAIMVISHAKNPKGELVTTGAKAILDALQKVKPEHLPFKVTVRSRANKRGTYYYFE